MKRFAVAFLVVMAACSSGSVTLHGFVRAAAIGDDCTAGADNKVSGKTLTVKDGSGNVVGTTVTEDPEYDETRFNDVCKITANYSVDVDKADFYEISLEGINQPSQPLSYDDLEQDDFRYDIAITDQF